jgi:hypothetical protein
MVNLVKEMTYREQIAGPWTPTASDRHCPTTVTRGFVPSPTMPL